LEQEIEIREILAIIAKRWWLLLVLLVLAVATSGIFSFFVLTPIYEASTTLIVGKPTEGAQIIYSDIQLNRQLVKTYGEIAKSSTVANDIISDMNLRLTAAQLKDKIDVRQVGDTEIISISVTDESPEHAAFLANGVARVFMHRVAQIMKTDNVSIIDPAGVPTSPVSPRKMLNIAVAAVLSLMVGFFLVFFMEYFDNTIKSPLDVERYLDMPLLGTIPIYEGEK
jgi:capsular polysaccharide biosynthesis protein